jgi:hypothetical protein
MHDVIFLEASGPKVSVRVTPGGLPRTGFDRSTPSTGAI